jgi:hypothetical protein
MTNTTRDLDSDQPSTDTAVDLFNDGGILARLIRVNGH